MFGKSPKNTSEYLWTAHSVFKMRQYGLSEQKIKNVIKRPKRKEEGIVKNTVAVMQPISVKKVNNKDTWKQEIWVMYQLRESEANHKLQETNPKQISNSKYQKSKTGLQTNKLKIISAWRYPGVSPKGNPIPEEILNELINLQ